MESLGKTLKSLREAKGMTLTDVSKATKIRITILSALENEEWENLPEKIFVRGFVKAYAQAVEGDESLIMDLFDSAWPMEDEKITCPTFEASPINMLGRDRKSYKWVFVLIVLIILAGGGYLLFQKYFNRLREVSNKPVKEETTIITPVKPEEKPPDVKPPQHESAQPSDSLNTEAVPSSETTATVSTSMGATQEKAQETGPTEPQGGKPAASTPQGESTPGEKPKTARAAEVPEKPKEASNDNLVITAKMETWVGLKIDGKTRKEILLKPGKTFSTKVGKFVELLIGNAGGIDITFNGKQIENIGKPGQVVRLRLPRKEESEN